jgi:prepilin-type N-terminal cleavage/methylation domain-containing protein
MIRRPPVRPGFTLLEVLLASVIALLLLGGMYAAFDLVLVRNDAAREEASRADLTRAVVNRMTLDLTAPVANLPPMSGGVGAAASATSTTTTTTSTDPAASTGTGTAAPTTSTETTTTETETTTVTTLPFGGGVYGSATQVTLFVSRVPQGVADPTATAADAGAGVSADLRRVSYYLGSGGGLCRQDRPWVTAAGVGDSAEPDYSAEAADLIAPEVTAASFEYYDGVGWYADWDGSLPGPDGVTPYGPPRAIRVTLTFEFPDPRGGDLYTRRVIHVFPVRAADGLYVPPATTDGTTTADATGAM